MAKPEHESERRTGADGPAGSFEENVRLTIPIEKLGIMNRLGDIGVDGVEDRLSRVGDYEGEVVSEQVKCGYVGADLLDSTFTSEDRVGVKVRLPGAPYGYAIVLFSKTSANNAATVMLSSATDDLSTVSNDLAHSALIELGGMMAYGFLDAWADAFDQEIDAGAPVPVHSDERDIISRTIAREDDLGLFIASKLHVPEHDIHADVYLFPENETFVEILKRLRVGMIRS
jgi:chemotaxis protein CheC